MTKQAKQDGPEEKETDLLWKFFCNEKWQEHEREILAWDGHLPEYTQEEYVKKNKDFLIEEWLRVFWPGHIVVKPDKT